MHRYFVTVCLCLVALLCSACGAAQTYQGSTDRYTASLTLTTRPVVNQSQAAIIRLSKDNQAFTATNVYCDMQMPGMTMGSNRPIADAQADGSFQCGVLFTMAGEWVIIVHGTDAENTFAIPVNDIMVSE